MLNLATVLEDGAWRRPHRDAIVLGERRFSYAALNAAANQVANLLVQRGVRPGDRIALSCVNLPQFPIVYFGILKAGAVVVPLNVLLDRRDIAYHLADSGARAYFCFEGDAELPIGREGWAGFGAVAGCEQFFLITTDPTAAPVGPETLDAALNGMSTRFATAVTEASDPAVILYTSGTTGDPRGAELSHANMVINALTCQRLFGAADRDVHLVTLPLFHSFGQTVQLNAGLAEGATLVLMPRFDPAAALSVMRRERVTFLAGLPAMYRGLLGAAPLADLAAITSTLRMAVSGGAPLPGELLMRVHQVFGVWIREGYGLSETSPVALANHADRPPRPGSVGQPVWGVRVRLIDDDWRDVPDGEPGEIAIQGHNVMRGYRGNPAATADVIRDGWLRTGDVGRRDANGDYYIVDRATDMIVRGGFNVYPSELEEVITTHPAVHLAAVVGVPHCHHGEEVKAFVVRRPGATLTEPELIAWCKENLAGYKYPRIVEFRDALPETPNGKILKRALRAYSPADGRP